MRAWITGGSYTQMGALRSNLESLDSAAQQFASDAGNGDVPPSDVSAVQNAAADLQADAQELGSDVAPACAAGMRADVSQAAADYQEVAIDADNAMGQYSAGAYSSAVSDLHAATAATDDGAAELSAATAAAKRFYN